jgi:hypothetical protein
MKVPAPASGPLIGLVVGAGLFAYARVLPAFLADGGDAMSPRHDVHLHGRAAALWC